MENKEEDIENLFRNRFDNDEADVSPKVWENIKKTLPTETDSLGHFFFQNSLWWFFSGLLLATLIASTLLYQNLNDDNDTREKTEVVSLLQTTKKDSGSVYIGKTSTYTTVSVDSSVQHSVSEYNRTNSTGKQNGLATNASSSTDIKKLTTHHKASSTHAFSKNTSPTMSLDKSNALILKKNKKQTLSHRSSAKENKTVSHEGNNNASKKSKNGVDENLVSSNATVATESSDREPNKKTALTKKEKKHILDRSVSNKQADKLNPPSSDKDLSIAAADSNVVRSTSIHSNSHSTNRTILKKENSTLSKNVSLSTEINQTNNTHSDSLLTSTDTTESHKKSAYNDSLTTTALHKKSSADSLQTRTNRVEKTSIDSVSTQTSPIKNKNTESTFNDSLATPIALDKKPDADSSLLGLKDSTIKSTIDSVLTKTSDKKEKSDTSHIKRWSFDVIGSGLLTGGSLKANDANYQTAADDKKHAQKNLPGYAFGIMINYKLNNKFRISTGLLYNAYSTTPYHFQYNLKKSDSILVDSTWQHKMVDSINTNKTMKDSYSFLSIPLQFSYTFLTKGKLQLSAIMGIRANFLLKGTAYLINEKGTDLMELNSGFRSVYFSYLASLEMQYQLKSHLALLAQPVFNYAANSIYTTSSPISQKPYSLGLTIGLRFTF